MTSFLRRMMWLAVGATWIMATSLGFTLLWRYEGHAGSVAHAPVIWPVGTHVIRTPGRPQLVMFFHPRCPCSRASVGELAQIMTHCQGRLTTTVLFVRPEGAAEEWEQTDLCQSAAAIPGVTVISDHSGRESLLFGAETSGQALLYSGSGRLVFDGGITESRGHSGDNEGKSSIISAILRESDPYGSLKQTPVFGCPLMGNSDTTNNAKDDKCRSQ